MDEQQWLRSFGETLKDVMEEYGYTQRELAQETGLSESTISNYIKGRQMPKGPAILNIVLALNCEFETLMYFGDQVYFERR